MYGIGVGSYPMADFVLVVLKLRILLQVT